MASVATPENLAEERKTPGTGTSGPGGSTGRGARLVGTVLLYIAVTLGSFIMILPFAWMRLGSVKDPGHIYQVPPDWIPNPFVFQNYINAWNSAPFATGYVNSATVTLSVVLANLLTCSMAAYAFARLEFPFRKTLYLLFLATLMVPEQVAIIPLYIIMLLNSVENYTVTLASNFFRGQYASDFALLMAGSAISIVPILIVYIIGQRNIIEGISTTGMKQWPRPC